MEEEGQWLMWQKISIVLPVLGKIKQISKPSKRVTSVSISAHKWGISNSRMVGVFSWFVSMPLAHPCKQSKPEFSSHCYSLGFPNIGCLIEMVYLNSCNQFSWVHRYLVQSWTFLALKSFTGIQTCEVCQFMALRDFVTSRVLAQRLVVVDRG